MDGVIKNLKCIPFIFKLAETVITIISLGLIDDTLVALNFNKMALVYGTLVGFLLLSLLIIIGTAINTPIHKILILMISLSAVILFFAAGSIMMEAYTVGLSNDTNPSLLVGIAVWWGTNKVLYDMSHRVLGSGVLTFINGVIYAGDSAYTFFKVPNVETEIPS